MIILCIILIILSLGYFAKVTKSSSNDQQIEITKNLIKQIIDEQRKIMQQQKGNQNINFNKKKENKYDDVD
jgi:hypothetical protein